MSGPDCRNPSACAGKKPGRNCRSCANWKIVSNPAVVAKRANSLRKRLEDPLMRQQWSRTTAQNRQAWLADPENMEKAREAGRAHAERVLFRPEVRERNQSAEVRARAGRSVTNNLLAWCPPEYRDQYRQLQRTMASAVARQLIEDQIKVDLKRYQRTGQLQACKGETK